VEEGLDLARLRRERNLYRKLLDLRRTEEIEPFLAEALALIVEVTGARRGYLELQGGGCRAAPTFWMARGCSDEDVALIRSSLSSAVIAEAIAGGRTILTASALTDPRFAGRGSVRANRIEAVLCAPIGTSASPLGVLYLQDHPSPEGFSEDDRQLAEDFADTVAVFADRLLIRREQRDQSDPTLKFRRLVGSDDIIGRSPALAKLLASVSVAAAHDVGVLLTGPSGSGKTRIARLIHENSARAKAPFVELNCATLTETLFESELFGHVRGAFTGADRDKTGLVRAAAGGTLFLDEVAEIPLTSQAKLLKFLESKEYRALGVETVRHADVRIIAATNVDLKTAAAKHAFRTDLYYRLEVMPVSVPSLAERREDIPALVRHFCERTAELFKLACIEPSEGALRAAEAAEWPGNIRQLSNAVQRAVVTAAAEGLVRAERRHLFPDDRPSGEPQGPGDARGAGATFQDATRAFQAALLQSTLRETNWNVTEAASRLDVTRAHVYNLIKAFGLARSRP
jgi:transcriptional regulator with GAF, ATPase, and Fis domain